MYVCIDLYPQTKIQDGENTRNGDITDMVTLQMEIDAVSKASCA